MLNQSELYLKIQDPLKLLFKAALIAFLSLVVGLILPAITANISGVFYRSTIDEVLPKEARKSLAEFDNKQQLFKRNIRAIDSETTMQNARANIQGLIDARSYYEKQLLASPSIIVQPFYLNPIMLIWTIIYCTLGWLIVILPPPIENPFRITWRRTLAISIAFYFFYQWTVWARNFVLSNEKRVVYSFANYDMSKAGFFIQELNTLIFTTLLAIFLQQWIDCYKKQRLIIKEENKESIKNYFNPVLSKQLTITFLHWQINSVILALGFISFTSCFWNLVGGLHDHRYLLAAITIHTIWGISWIVMSLPLLNMLLLWQSQRAEAISELINSEIVLPNINKEIILNAIIDSKPIGFWNIAASGVISLASFALPILQAFFK